MAALLTLPRQSDAFSAYRPSRNAHVDFLSPDGNDQRRDAAKDIKVIKITPKGEVTVPRAYEKMR